MQRRGRSEEQTRNRIVGATVDLHAERGIVATKPAEIAARADVSVSTFYKHFPTRAALVEACTRHAASLVPAPDPAAVKAVPEPRRRIASMCRTLFDFYAAREPFLYTGRTEERVVNELRPAVARLRALRNAFVSAAIEGLALDREAAAAVTALADFWAWRTLRRDVGLSQLSAIEAARAAVERIAGLGGRGRMK